MRRRVTKSLFEKRLFIFNRLMLVHLIHKYNGDTNGSIYNICITRDFHVPKDGPMSDKSNETQEPPFDNYNEFITLPTQTVLFQRL